MFKSKLKALQLGGYCYWCKQWYRDIEWLCPTCCNSLPWLKHACMRCATPLEGESTLCGTCIDWPYVKTSALFRFEYPITLWVHQMKYGKKWWLAKALGTMMASKMETTHRAVTWVPSTSKALRKRGFNPAWVLAKSFCDKYQLKNYQPFRANPKLLPQASLNKRQRIRLASKRFTLESPLPAQKILLIDDVLTTGATLLALINMLNKQGITDIQVFVLARALL